MPQKCFILQMDIMVDLHTDGNLLDTRKCKPDMFLNYLSITLICPFRA